MNKALAPIEHRDIYTRLVEREINAWLAEAIYAPIEAVLDNAGIRLDPKFSAIRFDEFGRQNSKEGWVAYPPEWGGLGLRRDQLPQIDAEARGALISFLASRGISYSEEWVAPQDLRPTQDGYYEEAVERAREKDNGDRAVLVSQDGYILDGHHRWTAKRLDAPAEPIRTLRFTPVIWPLIRVVRQFPSAHRENDAESALGKALSEGRVYYANGVFSGTFNSAITKELNELGASYDAGNKTFHLAESNIPLDLRGVMADAAQRSKGVSDGVLEVLRQMQENITKANVGIVYTKAIRAITDDMGKQLMTTTLAISPDTIAVKPEIDDQVRTQLEEGFTRNLNLAIKDFAQERIPELRARVEENAFKFGGRTDRLAKIIEAEFGVDKRKVEFLADQETGLLVSKYRAVKYTQLGIKDYIWSTSRDARVRESHRKLDGKRFSFATGALVSNPGQPARYCNPGEDYRCRCVPRPIINLEEIAA